MSYTTEVFEQSIYRTRGVVIDKCYIESDSYSTEIIKSYYFSCVTGYALKNLDSLSDAVSWCLQQNIELEDAIQLTKLKNSL